MARRIRSGKILVAKKTGKIGQKKTPTAVAEQRDRSKSKGEHVRVSVPIYHDGGIERAKEAT